MPRAKIFGYVAILISLILAILFFYNAFFNDINYNSIRLFDLKSYSYYSIAIPIGLLFLFFIGTGFWVGWTILTIKVAPPMPEIVEKKDFAKVKALLLCLSALAIAALFLYGVYIRSYWALAIPAAMITLVVLGMIFWVGIAIITTRTTLPDTKEE